MDKPKISICMIVYNHEKYVIEAIESVLSQIVSCEVEFIISNDNSPDKSDARIRSAIDQYKGDINIRYYNQSYNLGMIKNFLFALDKCKGKYIAFCEGDDYWISQFKLQKQFDFLEKHPDYSICFHPVKVWQETEQKIIKDNISREVDQKTTLKDLSVGNFMHTPSVMIRNNFHLPEWMKSSPYGDLPLWTVVAMNGDIYKLPEEMAVYRVHHSSYMGTLRQKPKEYHIVQNLNLENMYRQLYKLSRENSFLEKAADLINKNRIMATILGDKKKVIQFSKILLNKYRSFLSTKIVFLCIAQLFFPLLNRSNYSKFN